MKVVIQCWSGASRAGSRVVLRDVSEDGSRSGSRMRKWQFGVGRVLKSIEIVMKMSIWCGGCIFHKKVSVSCGSGDSVCRGVQARASLFSSL